MISNALDLKIRQMHAALAGLREDDLTSVQPHCASGDGYSRFWLDFNEKSDEIALRNKASLLIQCIASIKDHLKVWCAANGKTFAGEDLINSSRPVAIIHDLWNIDKHAALSRDPRSGFKPSLKNVRTALSLTAGGTPGSAAVFTVDPRTGKMGTHTMHGGKVQLALIGLIVDENERPQGNFEDICSEAVDAWIGALKQAGVPLP